jgi:DNA (cytosine-5)-methyltransferase 1
VVIGENVAEFEDWGPLDKRGKPIKARKGETFREWVRALEALGYTVERKTLRACDYGAPTIRNRLYFIARRDGEAIAWPEPTHGPGLLPYCPAAECIDWSIPSLSVFATADEARAFKRQTGHGARRPLADKTMRRVFSGLKRYVLDAEDPYLVDGAMVPWLINTRNGERKGQRPRTRSIRDPLPTITATDHHSLCAAYLTAYYGSSIGSDLREPMRTITTRDRFGLVLVEIDGTTYEVRDVTMRMLQPRELARGMGFPDDYVLSGTKRQQTARIGNAVCPDVAEALVRANLPELARGQA